MILKPNELKMYYLIMENKLIDTAKTRIEDTIKDMLTLRRLAKKHHRLAEMSCNGEGYIKGTHYYNGTIDDYARRTYGMGVKSAYIIDPNIDDTTIFDVESINIESKIEALAKKIGLKVEFQGDPRGNTVKLTYKNQYVEIFQ